MQGRYSFVTVRPLNQREKKHGDVTKVTVTGPKSIEIKDGSESLSFGFDGVHDPTNAETSLATAERLADVMSNGKKLSVFVYGPSSSGTRAASLGVSNTKQRGLLPDIVNALLRKGEAKVSIQAVELLDSKRTRDLLVMEDSKVHISATGKKTILSGANSIQVTNETEVRDVLQLSKSRSTVFETKTMYHHQLFKVKLERPTEGKNHVVSTLLFVLLGPSQRADATVDRKTAIQLNSDLTAIFGLFNKLAKKKKSKRNPFRAHYITKMIQPYLHPSATSVMIGCMTPWDTAEGHATSRVLRAFSSNDGTAECVTATHAAAVTNHPDHKETSLCEMKEEEILKWLGDTKQVAATVDYYFQQAEAENGIIRRRHIPGLIKNLFASSGLAPPSVSKLRAAWAELDKNHDDQITKQEFTEFLPNFVHREILHDSLDEATAAVAPATTQQDSKEAALTPDASGVRHIPIDLLKEAMSAVKAEGKSALLIDPSKRLDSYFTYSGASMNYGKGTFINIRFQNIPKNVEMEKLRKSLVSSLKYGTPYVLNLEDGASDFVNEYNVPEYFPTRDVFTPGLFHQDDTKWRPFVTENDFGSPHADFEAAAVTYFDLENYRDFLSQSIPLELFAPVEITPST